MPRNAYSQRYEQLRQQVLSAQGAARAWGLNLWQSRGAAAWINALRSEQAIDLPVLSANWPVVEGVPLPGPIQRQLATGLAEMILRREPQGAGSFL